MTTAIAIEDVRREVKILKSLSGHKNLVNFYDAYEDHDNVYIVMELVSSLSYSSDCCRNFFHYFKVWMKLNHALLGFQWVNAFSGCVKEESS